MITLNAVTLRRGPRALLEDVSFTLHAGWHVGVIGRNGTGKSSLFSAILGELDSDKGEIGVLTRNHYTEADWDRNNEWLVKDVSAELAGAATKTYTQKVDRAKFFKGRYKLDVEIPVETISVPYIPLASIADIYNWDRPGALAGGMPVGATSTAAASNAAILQ